VFSRHEQSSQTRALAGARDKRVMDSYNQCKKNVPCLSTFFLFYTQQCANVLNFGAILDLTLAYLPPLKSVPGFCMTTLRWELAGSVRAWATLTKRRHRDDLVRIITKILHIFLSFSLLLFNDICNIKFCLFGASTQLNQVTFRI